MQEEFFAEIDRTRPRYVVWMNLVPSLWMMVPPMHREVLDRLQPWVSARYGLEAALVAARPYALVEARQLSDLGGARVVALLLRRMD